MEDPNRKVPDLYFKVVDPKLQVADLKAEVGELRSGGIPPNLTPVPKFEQRFSAKFAEYVEVLCQLFAHLETPCSLPATTARVVKCALFVRTNFYH